MTSLFNTPEETAARLALAFPHLGKSVSLDELTAIDLAATYMHSFQLGISNLHGDMPYAAAEYDARRKRIKEGLARLVIDGLIHTDVGTTFTSTPSCASYADNFTGDYARAYVHNVEQLVAQGIREVQRIVSEGGRR